MAKIRFQFHKGNGSVFDKTHGRIVLSDHAEGDDGEHYLSAECVTANEVQEAADYLKKQLDRIVARARVQFRKD